MQAEAGTRIGPYVLESPLGAGGMGVVWRALDPRLGRAVAIKLLAAPDDPEQQRRFQRETLATSALNHPNILTVYDSGHEGGLQYLVSELVEGQTLREALEQGPLPSGQVMEIARQALRGLAAAHAAGLIHRDLKPENLMLRRDGYLKILDFGLARPLQSLEGEALTGSHVIVGTPAYMCPEQLQGHPVDARSDIFSLGAVLYELTTGRRAFPGATLVETIASLLRSEPPSLPVGLPEALDQALRRALQKDPERRFAQAQEMLAALEEQAACAPAPAPGPSVLVLPFSAAAEDQAVADGITEELISRLGRVTGLKVIGRSTCMGCRGREAREAGRELRVAMALEGNLRRSGSQLRVSVALVGVQDGFQKWSQRYQGEMRDIFGLEDQVADGVLAALDLSLGQSPSPPRESHNTLSMDLYHQALPRVHTGRSEDLGQALQGLRQAVELEPGFAPARARLSHALMLQSMLRGDPQMLALARSEAETAVNLSPHDPDALLALSMLASGPPRYDWRLARRLLRQALSLAPSHSEVMSRLALVDLSQGNMSAAQTLARRAVDLDPNSPPARASLALVMMVQGQFHQALEVSERALRDFPSSLYPQVALLWLDLLMDRQQDAVQYADYLSGLVARPPPVEPMIALVRLRSGRISPEEFRGLVLTPRHSLHVDVARISAGVLAQAGFPELATEQLKLSYARGMRNPMALRNDPLLQPLQAAPIFLELCQRLDQDLAEDAELGEPHAP